MNKCHELMLSPARFQGLTDAEICYMCRVYSHHIIKSLKEKLGASLCMIQEKLDNESKKLEGQLSQIVSLIIPEQEGNVILVKFHAVQISTVNMIHPKITMFEWNCDEKGETNNTPPIKIITLLTTIWTGGLECLINQHPKHGDFLQQCLLKVNMTLLKIKMLASSISQLTQVEGDQDFAVGKIEFLVVQPRLGVGLKRKA